jgi:tetratricopeptide (TPR) repeat protein
VPRKYRAIYSWSEPRGISTVTSLVCDVAARDRYPLTRIASLCLLLAATCAAAQTPTHDDSVLKQHYDLAQSYQSSGNFPEAARQYRIFIADALAEMALQSANIEDYSKAAPFFDEALRLAPNSPGLKVRYAQAALAAHDLSRTRTLTEGILRDYPNNVKADAKAHLLLGRALLRSNQEAEARPHFEAAVALDPNFENGYALAIACLDLGDGAAAAKIFSEMVAGLGDTAVLHVEIGRAYLNSDFQQDSIPEFKKAIAKDNQLAGAHYSLAVAYLTVGGDGSEDAARNELEAELKLSPKDSSTHAQLGNIALRQHRYADAEQELKRAADLDATDPNVYFYLGQLYIDTGRNDEAVAALRQSISFTKDAADNRYQVQKAHYLLGHLLIQLGQTDVGKQEMQISSALLKRSLNHDRDRLAGESDEKATAQDKTPAGRDQPSPQRTEAIVTLERFEKRIAPALADSYNNLGVIAASDHAMAEALTSFERAYEWNPELAGLDTNWGRAAFQAGRYAEAVSPLARSLRSGGSDAETRSELAISYFKTGDYAGTLKLLEGAAASIETTPQLAYIYAASLVKTGNEDAGMKRLLGLEKADPKVTDVHLALGEIYAAHKDFAHAIPELRLATELNPQDAEAYTSLGSVELEHGNLPDAIHYLEIAARLDPANRESHGQLTLAYRKSKRGPDADREQAIYEALEKSGSGHPAAMSR